MGLYCGFELYAQDIKPKWENKKLKKMDRRRKKKMTEVEEARIDFYKNKGNKIINIIRGLKLPLIFF